MNKTVFVGLSGGVDSSVATALLKEQGYGVVGVYMKNWSQDLPGFPCPWKEDYQDAKRVAVQLGIPFEMFDFEKEYRHKVVDYMIEGFKSGITPNPDIMCNQEIKFKLFLGTALERGANMIATGHYSRVINAASNQSSVTSHQSNNKFVIQTTPKKTLCVSTGQADDRQQTIASLHMAADANKDQTYFLYRVTKEALEKTLFPLGDYTKPQVRALAKKFGLVTATKKESMGICFVGKVGIKDFLKQYVKEKSGAIIDQSGKEIGKHEGAIFYTIGQRHGLDVGGGMPYYVIGKNMTKNEVYVSNNLDDKKLWSKKLTLTSLHWINGEPDLTKTYLVRTRHRAPLIKCTLANAKGRTFRMLVKMEDEVRAATPGQSAVIYDGDRVAGGGIIASAVPSN